MAGATSSGLILRAGLRSPTLSPGFKNGANRIVSKLTFLAMPADSKRSKKLEDILETANSASEGLNPAQRDPQLNFCLLFCALDA
jgi:hypothetical protein